MKITARCIFVATILLCLPVAMLTNGCQGTRTQQVLFTTTDALGKAVNTATDQFNDWIIVRGKAELGPSATADSMLAWMKQQKSWQDVMEKRSTYLLAYNAWCSANAVAASGTNAVSAVQTSGFRDAAIRAASDLTMMISTFVPSVKIVK